MKWRVLLEEQHSEVQDCNTLLFCSLLKIEQMKNRKPAMYWCPFKDLCTWSSMSQGPVAYKRAVTAEGHLHQEISPAKTLWNASGDKHKNLWIDSGTAGGISGKAQDNHFRDIALSKESKAQGSQCFWLLQTFQSRIQENRILSGWGEDATLWDFKCKSEYKICDITINLDLNK